MTAAAHGSGPSFDRIHAAITAVTGPNERRGPDYVNVCCPAHDDSDPSLTLRYDSTKGRTYLHCQTGVCSDTDVLAAAGLSIRDLFDQPGHTNKQDTSTNGYVARDQGKQHDSRVSAAPKQTKKDELVYERVCSYVYTDREGDPRGKVNRYLLYNPDGTPHRNKAGEHKKSFRQYHFDTTTRRWKKGHFAPLLYHLDQIVQAVGAGESVLLVEGEKDADTAREAWGVCATTNAQGGTKFRPEHAEQLAGAHVVVVCDADRTGYKHGLTVQDALAEHATSVRFVRAAAGKDTAEHIAAGHAQNELVDIDPEAELAKLDATEGTTSTAPNQSSDEENDNGGGEPGDGPKCPVPMSTGQWAYSTGQEGEEHARGLYRLANTGWEPAAPLPYVLERLIRRDGAGRPAGRFYRMAMRYPLAEAGEVAIVADDDVKSGLWADFLDVSVSADQKIVQAVATAIRMEAERAPRRDLSPRWVGGELETPPSDVGPPGYGVLAPDEQGAVETWRQIADIAARNPKVAFVLGASIAAPFIAPLGAQSFVLSMAGQAYGGKTVTMETAASVWGDPSHEGIVKVLDTSVIGLTQQLGTMGCLPAFFDECQASEIFQKPAQVQKMIFSVSQGAKRTVGGHTGTPRTSHGWRGILFLTGNVSVTGMLNNEGAIRRTVEVTGPITQLGEDADALTELVEAGYGWPVHWQRQAGFRLDAFRQLVTEAFQDIQVPQGGGIAKAFGHSLALAVAGAARLEQVVGATGFHAAALEAATELLTAQLDELEEQGATPGARAVSALLSAWVSRPAMYPTRSAYAAATAEDEYGNVPGAKLTRDVEGWDLTDERGERATLALLKDRFAPLCQAAGIDAPAIALRELDAARILVRSEESDGRRRSFLRVGAKSHKTEVYRFRFDEQQLAGLNLPGTAPANPGNDAVPSANSTTRPDPANDGDHTDPSPVSPGVPGSDAPPGDTLGKSVSSINNADTQAVGGPVPGVPGPDEHSRGDAPEGAVVITFGAGGPVWKTTQQPCRVCSNLAPSRDRHGPVHAMCAQTGDTTEQPVQEQGDEGVCPSCGGRSVCWDEHTDTWLHATCTLPEAPSEQTSAAQPEPTVTDQVGLTLTELPPVEPDTLAGPLPHQPNPYSAACMVIDRTGIYLPDGQRFAVEQQPGDSADLLQLARTLNLGHPGGPGQIILTDSAIRMLELEVAADDGAVGQDARDQLLDRLGERDDWFNQRARTNGWDIGPLAPECRARATDGRAFDVVLAPYLHIWARGRMDAHPMGLLDKQMDSEDATDEGYAAESARVMGYLAQLLGQPWRVTGVQAGWDLFDRAQKRRGRRRDGHQLTVPGQLPKLTGGSKLDTLAPPIKWRRPALREPELAQRYIVHLDRIMAWPAAAREVRLGYCTETQPNMLHHHGADAVAALLTEPTKTPAGLYRVWLPAHEPGLPPIHGEQSSEQGRMLWLPADTVRAALAEADPAAHWVGAGFSLDELLHPETDHTPEAWTFPAEGRLLGGVWADTIRDARYQTKHADPLADEMIKRLYGGMLQSLEAELSDKRAAAHRARTHCQQTWRASLVAHNYAWQAHLVRKLWLTTGHAPAAVEIDEIAYLTDEPDNVALGNMDGRIGQYARKRVRELSDEHRTQLARDTSPFHLHGGLIEGTD